MVLRNVPSFSAVNFWPALLDVVTAAFMVFVLSTYLQLVMTLRVGAEDAEAARVRALEAQFLDKLRESLAADLASGAVEVGQDLGLIHIRFSDQVLFATNDYELNDAGRQLLGRFGRSLAFAVHLGVRRVQVEGHTDSVPFVAGGRDRFPKNNWQLSSARATEVTLFLLAGPSGLPARLFTANGYGANRPIADNHTARGRARNRRVEIELVFAGQEQP